MAIDRLLLFAFVTFACKIRNIDSSSIADEKNNTDICFARYTTSCLFLDINKLVDEVKNSNRLNLWPGVYVSVGADASNLDFSQYRHRNSVHQQFGSGVENVNNISGHFLLRKLKSYLEGTSLIIDVSNLKPALKLKNFNRNLFDILLFLSDRTINGEGRSRKRRGSNKAAMMATATMAAIGGSALFAMAGKAAAASFVALLLALACLLKGHGGGGHGHGHYTAYSSGALMDTPSLLLESSGETIIDASSRGNYYKKLKYLPKYYIDDKADRGTTQIATYPVYVKDRY